MEAFKPRFSVSKVGAKLSRSPIRNVPITYLDKTYYISYLGMGALGNTIQLNYSWGTEEVQLLISTNHLCDFIDPELQGLIFEDLSDELHALLIQVVSEIMKDIFAQFQQTLVFKSGNLFKNEQPIARLSISNESNSVLEIGVIKSKTNSAFFDTIAQLISPEPASNIPLTFCFNQEFGGVRLSLEELRTLRLGDILLNQWQKHIVRFSYKNFAFWGKQENNNISVIKKLMNEKEDLPVGIIPDETEPETTEETTAEQSSEAPAPAESNPTATLDNLPINIVFQVGQQNLTLEQLQQIQEGYVFELEPNVDEQLNIVANGQVIGQGRWVQIEDHTGVQVTHLAKK